MQPANSLPGTFLVATKTAKTISSCSSVCQACCIYRPDAQGCSGLITLDRWALHCRSKVASWKPPLQIAIVLVVLYVRIVNLCTVMCCSAATSTLRWAMTRAAVPGSAKVLRNGETRNKERSIDIKKILKVETGTSMFPGSSGTKGMLPLQ